MFFFFLILFYMYIIVYGIFDITSSVSSKKIIPSPKFILITKLLELSSEVVSTTGVEVKKKALVFMIDPNTFSTSLL